MKYWVTKKTTPKDRRKSTSSRKYCPEFAEDFLKNA